MSLTEAEIILKSQKMRCELSDSVYVGTAKPGFVVNQNPEPGSKVKEKRKIYLVVNALAPEKVIMPNVVGVSFRQAKSMLESRGLSIGRISTKPDRYKDYVRKQFYRGQEIKVGTEIIKGSEIDLEIGSGLSSERTSIPNLLGNTLREADKTITQYVLNFGVIIYDNTVITSADSANAFIYQQRPIAAAGATLQLGSAIDVWLSVDETKKPGMTHEIETD
jgi:beta-lactam-binding protein with PASTA domain